MIINLKRTHNKTIILITLLASVCMLTTSLVNGSLAYGAEAPAGDENFNYNGYSATQLKNISECISGVIPASKCPAYEASSKDYYTGTVNHDNMPASGSIINTKIGWRKWADAAMKANSYDGVYGTLRTTKEWNGKLETSSDIRFRLIGINQDNRADGRGKAGLTFQAIGSYYINTYDASDYLSNSEYAVMNPTGGNYGHSWRDTILRQSLNDKSGTLHYIASDDFKQNITPVLKITNNNSSYYIDYDNYGGQYTDNSSSNANASSVTVDKLFILSPSEIGMPVIRNYNIINEGDGGNGMKNANAHYYNSGSYKNTIKTSNDSKYKNYWNTHNDYLYAGNTYQWWMLPAGSRKMSNSNQAYHNTDTYSYCLNSGTNPSTNTGTYSSYWLRSPAAEDNYNNISLYARYSDGSLRYDSASYTNGLIIAFSF